MVNLEHGNHPDRRRVVRHIDRFSKVGSRHHVIPKFILERWADANDRIWVKSKYDQIEGVRNIRDLGITDFYTYLAIDNLLDSTMEELHLTELALREQSQTTPSAPGTRLRVHKSEVARLGVLNGLEDWRTWVRSCRNDPRRGRR